MSNSFRSVSILMILFFLITSCQSVHTPAVTPTTAPTHTSVTYVGNSGFLITVGDKKILIDALFAGFPDYYHLPDEVLENLMSGTPPFDQVDLVVATHNHDDHFSVQTVRKYLEKYPDVKFISTVQVTKTLLDLGDRVITMDANYGTPVEKDIDGIHLEAIYLSHGKADGGSAEIINNAYVITMNGITILHTGDIDASLLTPENLSVYDLPNKHIDIAFIQHFLLSNPAFQNIMNDVIKPKYVMACHYQLTDPIKPTIIRQLYPDAIIFTEELQSWEKPE